MRMSFSRAAVLVLALCGAIAPVAVVLSSPVLRQVHIITRHGSRYPLTKDPHTLEEDSRAGTLSPLGQRQLYDVGRWLQDRYNNQIPSARGSLMKYEPTKFRLESSPTERTIVSANALALGMIDEYARDPKNTNLLPVPPVNVPVYMKDPDNDVTIQAYNKCPAFQQKLNDLYQSDEWTKVENDHEKLLKHLGGIENFAQYVDDKGKIPLKELWNVYDAIHVARTECHQGEDTDVCQALPDPTVKDVLDDVKFGKLKKLTHKVELMRYGPKTAEKMLGGNLLLQISERMQVEPADSNDVKFEKFYLYSAHYPTILGVFAALNQDPIDSEGIPEYATCFVFELWEDPKTDERFVTIVYKPGANPKTTHQSVIFRSPCSSEVHQDKCPLSQFVASLSDVSYHNWCQECQNDSADVCLADAAMGSSSAASSPVKDIKKNSAEEESCSSDKGLGLGIGIAIGLAIAVFSALVWFYFCGGQRATIGSIREASDITTSEVDKLT